ncbi:Dihydroflavonol-4-reductase [Labilithrix luteola]|uniref:Dihydroflavonol-4-reductase n=1 Tax=Labilithrix luteola TaxID=1391654 RepID=A0A0K1PLX1_9BACT|nr:NAD-dependent epimerase/dehydratase family protein [Labilithrix luteola]AKU94109.1 Dihydroflavonol-4-reductase [Labilithrix luteola]
MKVFVTGSTGLLGNNLVRELRSQGHDVVALARSVAKAARMLDGTGARVVSGDMRDVDAFADELRECDAVVHTAAYFREYYSPAEGGETHAAALDAVNVKGTLALLDAADKLGVQRFIHVGSSGAVGVNPDGSPGDETTPPSAEQLSNLYFRSKAEGDAKIVDFAARHEIAVIEILPGWMWGPGDAGPTGAGQLYLDFCNGKIPGAPPGGSCTVDARDVARAIVAALTRGHAGERYIVGGEFRTLREILDALADASGRPRLRFAIPAPVALAMAHGSELWAKITRGTPAIPLEGVKAMLLDQRVSSHKAQRDLGATFRPLAETMRDVVGWYDRNAWATAGAKKSADRPTQQASLA